MAVPIDNAVRHTGTGRISRILMRPISLFEPLESNGSVTYEALFNGITDGESISALSIENLAYALTRGGWPASIGEKQSVALQQVYSYVDAVINMDVSRIDEVEKNPAKVRMLMRSLARNVSTTANIAALMSDFAGDEDSISEKTVSSYLNALRRNLAIGGKTECILYLLGCVLGNKGK